MFCLHDLLLVGLFSFGLLGLLVCRYLGFDLIVVWWLLVCSGFVY